MSAPERNLAASTRQRLLNLARARGEDFNFLLTAYCLERLMYRLGQSSHRREFVLKGAMLLRAWEGEPHRATRDLDLLGWGAPDIPRLERIFGAIWATPVPADGLELEPGSIPGEEIRETQEYGGIRLRMVARLGNARIPLQVDVGFGDAVTPGVAEIRYPTLLNDPAPVLYAYPRETVVAEKLQAMVLLGVANTRMKDFYDLWILGRRFDFDGPSLANAIAATFRRRSTPLPAEPPVALTPAFANDPARRQQWSAFLTRVGDQEVPRLPEIIDALRGFLLPLTGALHAGKSFTRRWPSGGPWTDSQ